MAGAYYIWIMAAFFLGCVGVMGLLVGLFWFGHWMEKKETGATHGFLEVPPGAQSRPVKSAPDADPPPPASPAS
jgi:hypothetical protein